METFRYRKLKQGDSHSEVWVSDSKQLASVDAAGAVYDIEAEEGEADLDTLVALLKKGALMPSDLVFSQGQWRTISDAPEFYELCEGLYDTRVESLKLASIGKGLLAWLLFVALHFAIPYWVRTSLIPQRKHVSVDSAVVAEPHHRLPAFRVVEPEVARP